MRKILLSSFIALGMYTNAQINNSTAATYCTASSGTGFEVITNVKFENINKSSTATGGYSDYTALVANVVQNNPYTITVTPNVEAYEGDELVVWIDYNQNGDFADPGEKVFVVTKSKGPYTGTITIPTTALLGQTRMRIRLNDIYNTTVTSPCGTAMFGEVEDYTVNITAPTMQVADSSKNNVSIYPNPFVDIIKISDIKGIKTISVNDVSGRLAATFAPSTEINLSNLQKGVYIVNLQMLDGSVKTIKAIKK